MRPCRRNSATCSARKISQQRRQHAGVQREEPRERVMAVVAAADDEPLQRLADDRHQRHHVRGHLRGPIAFLVPRQQVAGERQRQHDLHQDQAEPEIDFARRAVRAVDHDLHEVHGQQHDHRVGREVMHAAQAASRRSSGAGCSRRFPRRFGGWGCTPPTARGR